MYLLFLVLFLISNAAAPIEAAGGLRGVVGSAWKQFWSVSCQYTSVISRSKRSIEIPSPTDAAEDFFDYLYPSADISIEDVKSQGRSESSGRGWTTWVDDVIDVWHTECERRRMQAADEEFRPTTPTPRKRKRTTQNPKYENSTDLHDTSTLFSNSTEIGDGANKTTRQLGLPMLPALPTLMPLPSFVLPTIDPLAIKQEDKFFSQYGGDIEYFIPLVGYGIPFDGEITVLGFHGFKGLFPYRR